jgi:hypothetical protein
MLYVVRLCLSLVVLKGLHECECVIFKVGQNYRRENMDLLAWLHARDTQLSNNPIGASIRVREVPIQQCQLLTAHSTQLWS